LETRWNYEKAPQAQNLRRFELSASQFSNTGGQANELPFATRDAMQLVLTQPGVTMPGNDSSTLSLAPTNSTTPPFGTTTFAYCGSTVFLPFRCFRAS
jgi:hypothetical protein